MVSEIGNNQTNRVFRLILLLVFIIFAFLLFFLYQTRKKAGEQANNVSVTYPTPVISTIGSFSLQSVSGETKGALDKPVELDIVANSEQNSIVGYDVIVKFEKGALEILSAESLLLDFSIYPLKKSDHYIVTGTKKLGSNEPTVFANNAILRLKVLPKVKGALTLSLVNRIGLEKSQMVNEKTKVLIPEVGGINFEIE